MEMEETYIPESQVKYLDEFIKPLYIYGAMTAMILTGKVGSCTDICGRVGYYSRGGNCDQYKGGFCKRKYYRDENKEYKNINWLLIYRNMIIGLTQYKTGIVGVIGEYRFNMFIEILTTNANKEDKTIKIIKAKPRGMNEIMNDPWQVYVNKKIKGESKCFQLF